MSLLLLVLDVLGGAVVLVFRVAALACSTPGLDVATGTPDAVEGLFRIDVFALSVSVSLVNDACVFVLTDGLSGTGRLLLVATVDTSRRVTRTLVFGVIPFKSGKILSSFAILGVMIVLLFNNSGAY